ncbi:MAG: hypothetical protein KDI90_05555 [Alphaproteobacteria bacterium]|nr:hypothetical protein [Alphaproteobacteria bacterium]MCB9974895.1 hypothetical protein [Rhodospirillales bacterium]
MAISKARKRFRVFLGVALVLSLAFFGTTAYVYMEIKNKTISIAQIGPTLFTIDVTKHQIFAAFSSDEKKLEIGKKLYQQGVFSPQYARAGEDMIRDLADRGHAPAQTAYGDLIYARFIHARMNAEQLPVAQDYYRMAAEQGYEPAQQRLANVTYRATIAMADALSP